MSERLSVLIPAEMMKEIDEFQKVTNLDKSTLIRQLLKKSIREMKIEYALKAYAEEKVSFGKAADIAGLNIWEFIDEAHRRKVELIFTVEDAERELRRRREEAKK